MIISKKRYEREVHEAVAKALEEQSRKISIDREINDLRRDLYMQGDQLRDYMHKLEARLAEIECIKPRNEQEVIYR